jgi:hypothetical protein
MYPLYVLGFSTDHAPSPTRESAERSEGKGGVAKSNRFYNQIYHITHVVDLYHNLTSLTCSYDLLRTCVGEPPRQIRDTCETCWSMPNPRGGCAKSHGLTVLPRHRHRNGEPAQNRQQTYGVKSQTLTPLPLKLFKNT